MKTALNILAVANVIGVSAALDVTKVALAAAHNVTLVALDALDGFEDAWRTRAHAVIIQAGL